MSIPAGPATFLNRGAILQFLWVDGQDIVLNFAKDEEYEGHNDFYFGAIIGRVANRIQNGYIECLNGTSHNLATNNGRHSLHGGLHGWDKKLWTGPEVVRENGRHQLVFSYRSPDGEEGYPGIVEAIVTYLAYVEISSDGTEVTVLEMEHEARLVGHSDEDAIESVVNMTNHSYFNIGSSETIDGTMFKLSTGNYLEAESDGIPTGSVQNQVPPANFSILHSGYKMDRCYVLDTEPKTIPLDTRQRSLRTAATFWHPTTLLELEIQTTEPAFQFYTGDYVNVPSIGSNPRRLNRAGFCIEPCRYVNAINKPEWRNMVLLARGQVYGSRTVYRSFRRQKP